MKPETLYTNVGDAQVAYQVFGDGPDLVYSIGYFVSHVDLLWEQPDFARFLQRLGSFARVTIFDRRGTGASDPLTQSGGSWWEDWVDDLDAVLAATGAERPSLMASTDAGPMAIAFAATYPERVASLVLMNTGARSLPAPDYPHGVPEEHRGFGRFLEEAWGKEDGPLPDVTWPARAGDPEYRRWIAQVQRAIMTPRRAAALWAMEMEVDVRRAVPLIQAPTLVVSTDFPLIPVGNSEYLAEHIAGARLLMLEGRGAFGWLEDAERLLEGIEELVTGEHKPVEPDRVLATVLFTDIVGSTERAAELGDRRWRELLDR
ncbi:MAG: alpha/beta fold hydrolase, partial [Actinomycetota bacterium]